VHAGNTAFPGLGVLGLLLADALVKNLGILIGSVLAGLGTAALDCDAVALVLETLRSDQALDPGGLGIWLRALLLRLHFTADNKFTDIVFLAETEEAADLGRTLGTQALGVNGIRKTRNVFVTLLHNGQSKDRQVHSDDASANRLSLSLTSAAGTVAAVAIGEEEADTSWVHDTLLHREALLVVTAGDLEDVALEFVANTIAGDFVAHAAIHKDTELALIFDLDELLRPVGRV